MFVVQVHLVGLGLNISCFLFASSSRDYMDHLF